MSLEANNTPNFSWDVRLDRSLQQPIKIIAAKQNVEIRVYITNVLREAVLKEAEMT